MALTPGLQLPFGIQPVNPVPVDTYSGPYYAPTEVSGLTAANAAIPSALRFPSMEVRLIINGVSNKYWYYSGITDSDLVLFNGGGGGTSGGNSVTSPVEDGVLVSDGTTTGITATEILKVDSDGVVLFNTVSPTGLTGNTVVTSFNKTIGSAYYFDYYVEEQTSGASRSGTVTVVWKGTTVEYMETSTPDILGSTLDIAFSAAISDPNIQLTAEITSGTWDIKVGTRAI